MRLLEKHHPAGPTDLYQAVASIKQLVKLPTACMVTNSTTTALFLEDSAMSVPFDPSDNVVPRRISTWTDAAMLRLSLPISLASLFIDRARTAQKVMGHGMSVSSMMVRCVAAAPTVGTMPAALAVLFMVISLFQWSATETFCPHNQNITKSNTNK
jgi:hypothetical protein